MGEIMMSMVNDNAFHVMCDMWGVDEAINVSKRMGVIPTAEQIKVERQKENAAQERWNNIFKQEPKEKS